MITQLIPADFPFTPPIDRKQGIHVSDIIQSIMVDLRRSDDSAFTEEQRIRMEAGFLWERMAEMAWHDLLGFRPEELCVDGIWLSPDYVKTGDKVIVRELKCTWMSTNKDPWDNDRYRMQSMSYCHALHTDTVHFFIYYVNGNYKPPAPQFKGIHEIVYDQRELEENWQAIVNHATYKNLL